MIEKRAYVDPLGFVYFVRKMEGENLFRACALAESGNPWKDAVYLSLAWMHTFDEAQSSLDEYAVKYEWK